MAKKNVPTQRWEGHGLRKHWIYNVWQSMLRRCYDPNRKDYRHYGGRGITVCERWESLAAFYQDMGDRPSPKHQLERIDNEGNYEPSNCCWTTPTGNKRNRRDSVFLEHDGRILHVGVWAELLDISKSTIKRRLKQGMSASEALTKPLHPWRGRS